MSSDPSIPTETLTIAEKAVFTLENYRIEVLSYLGCFTPNVHSFKVNLQPFSKENPDQNNTEADQLLGLLRVGTLNSGLNRELEIRDSLKDYGLIAPLIVHNQLDSVLINTTQNPLEDEPEDDSNYPDSSSEKVENRETFDKFSTVQTTSDESQKLPLDDENEEEKDANSSDNLNEKETTTTLIDNPNVPNDQPETLDIDSQESEQNLSNIVDDLEEEDYLPEEIYEDETQEPSEQILLLTEFPLSEHSLAQLLETYSAPNKKIETSALNLVIQLCQCCLYLSEKKWHLVNLVPHLIEFNQRLKLYDLTQIFPEQEKTNIGLVGGYCAPELATDSSINSLMSSYTVGALLYQLIHHQLPNIEHNIDFFTEPIPRFYQLLKKVLSPVPEERFILTGLRQLLLEAREELSTPKIHWETASRSTVGLSLERLQNEDNFGIRYEQLNNKDTLMMGMVADGMGGMDKGEVASQIAVETLLKEAIPTHFKSSENKNAWLTEMFQKANQAIAAEVENGGTTLSVILAVNEQLMIAHVGDSRIYLLRQGEIQQLSQDHSYVALLFNNGEISEEEMENHPDKNVLLRSLGSKEPLREGHVQNLSVTINQLVLNLEDQDILLLCSDGVWDLVSKQRLQEIFTHPDTSLQEAVDKAIQTVLDGGAFDNATLLALQYGVLN